MISTNTLQLLLVAGILCISLPTACLGDDACVAPAGRSLSLCPEFQAVRDLIPRETIDNLVQLHYATDSRFRKAVKFLQSSAFGTNSKLIDDSATYQSFMTKFKDAGVNVTDIDGIEKIFQCLILPLLPGVSSRSVVPVEARSLQTLVVEVINQLPKEEYVSTVKEFLANNENFAKFYKLVRNAEFREQVLKGFKNRDVSRPVKKFRSNQVDLCELAKYAFDVASIGPEAK